MQNKILRNEDLERILIEYIERMQEKGHFLDLTPEQKLNMAQTVAKAIFEDNPSFSLNDLSNSDFQLKIMKALTVAYVFEKNNALINDPALKVFY